MNEWPVGIWMHLEPKEEEDGDSNVLSNFGALTSVQLIKI